MPVGCDADYREDLDREARERRQLKGTNAFENLGKPIQDLLLQLQESDEGLGLDDRTLELLKHVPVKALAKVFDMLAEGQDPETILAWLKRRARKSKKGKDDGKDKLKDKIRTGAERDPIAFFKEIEAANQERIRQNQELQEERDKLRQAKAKERERKRKEQQEAAEAAKKAIEDDGGWWKATDALPEKHKAAINSAFEKFANDNSCFDNSDKDQDGEWWKKDQFRRDWERNKAKGKKWTAVIEGAKEPATEAELAVREEFYKSNDWWKADKYKQDWEATKDNEWWKEEPYIKDWTANKHEGQRWRAADEESGLEGEAAKYPATPEELRRREQWYKANGPRGVVKRWNAATEGDPEKCSVPEKLEREEYYRNGDWWKSDDARLDFKERGLECDPLQHAAEQQAKDKEWWKAEPYREDFWKNQDKGKKWTGLNEEAGIDGTGDKKPAPAMEKEKREKWYKDNWWKANKFKDDWKKNGPAGKLWRAPNEKDAAAGGTKSVGPEEARKREDWYKSIAPDEEWWKDPKYIEDYHQNGDSGRGWPAKTQAAALGQRGQEDPANRDEQKKREEWYKQNWWKQPKYVEDFVRNPNSKEAPGSAAWTQKSDDPGKDKDWWKQPAFVEDWQKQMAPKTQEEWWKQPEYVADFNTHGPEGKKWLAAKETDGIFDKGQEKPAAPEEQKKREQWYKDNWWKAPQYAADWAKKGQRGEKWKAASKASADDPKVGASEDPCSPDERRRREEYFKPEGDMWRATGENEGWQKKAKEYPCPKDEALKRDGWFRANWWKAPEYIDDWKKNGGGGKKWTAGCEDSGKKSQGGVDPCPDEEKRKRDEWYKNQGDVDWWKEPTYVEDWARNGKAGRMWGADNRPNAQKYGGDEHPATPEEKKAREEWYKDNWWKTPHAMDDWKKRGKDGDTWTRKTAPAAELHDPETEGDNWWKHPSYVEDWLKNGPEAKQWTAEDPVSAAMSQGHKKPAADDEKAKRDKWYKDNFWKAPSLADDWTKKGAQGKAWTAANPDAAKAEEGDKTPASADEKKKREDWYKKRGDKDDWWKRPEFIEDYHDSPKDGKKWTAANPTAASLAQGATCPASGPEKDRRAQWYMDNWWKSPKCAADWKKGGGDWKKEEKGMGKDAPASEQKKRDDWYKANAGEPASPDEQAAREDWYKKHAGEPSGPQLAKREDWFRKQLPDEVRKRRMDWLRQRAPNDKRIMDDELPDALAAVNEGQRPTEDQVQAVRDHIKKNRECKCDDFEEIGRPEEDDSIGQDEFLQAVADTNFYVAPDKDELEMQAEEERENQEMQDLARQEEEAAFLAMEREEELKASPEQWQKKARDPTAKADEWWKKPEFIENYQQNPDVDAAQAHWGKKGPGSNEKVDPEEQKKREDWFKENWWKAPEYSQQWRRNAMGDDGQGDGWKKDAKPPPADPDSGERPEDGMADAPDDVISDREKWYRNAQAPERMFRSAEEQWWKQPQYVEAFQEGDDACFRAQQDDAAECTPEEKAEREQWFKDNWWKAPKHMEEWKKAAKEDKPATAKAGWARSAAPPAEDDDGMARAEAEEEPAAAAQEEIADREAWYKKATETMAPFAGEKFDAPPPQAESWGKRTAEAPFVGEKFVDPVPAAAAPVINPFTGEKFDDGPDLNDFTGEKLDDPFAGEKLPDDEPEEPFIGEKFGDDGAPVPLPAPANPFTGEKFENEDDKEAAPFEGEKLEEDPSMKDEDPRELDDDEEAAFEKEQEAAEEEEAKEADDEDAAWAEGADDDDDDEAEEDDDDDDEEDEADNEHQDDDDLEAELEAALEEEEPAWEEGEEEEEAESQ